MTQESRDSRWQVIRRCLAMIRRLQRGPASWEALAEAVQAEISEAYVQPKQSSRKKQFDNDKAHLVHSLGLGLKYNRRTHEYLLYNNDYPLLELPSEDLATIAWLKKTFESESPEHQPVEAFLNRLISFLGPERREEIERQRFIFKLDLARRDDNHVPVEVREGIVEALVRSRRVGFDYRSSTNSSGIPWRHIVDPYEYFFEDGHYYLKGKCQTVAQGGQSHVSGSYTAYRLDGMSNFQLLPNKVEWPPPKARQYKVRYRLEAEVVRHGVSRQRWIDFDDPEDLEWQADGSVIVNGMTDNDFFAAQALLRYGHRCRVLNKGPVKDRILESAKKILENEDTYPS